MSLYLDTRLLAALFIEADAFHDRASTSFAEFDQALVVSDFVATEFAFVIARAARMNAIK